MAPGPDGEEFDFPNWGNPSCKSILDVDIRSVDEFPFEPPVADYLEESLNGLRGSPHDVKTRHEEPKLRRYVDHLFRIVGDSGTATSEACSDLFSIALGLLFGRMLPEVVEVFRGNLARSWHSILLAATKEIPLDLNARDWAKVALPQVMVQAIYRLLIDAFPLERSEFIKNVAQVLDKLMQLVHFETSGFQVHQQTVRQERRRLFVRYVLNNPHVSLEELERDQKLQESQNKTVSDQPLTFGTINRQAMEKEQMKHIMEVREETREKAQATMLPGMMGTRETASPPRSPKVPGQESKRRAEQRWAMPVSIREGNFMNTAELGIERYEGLAERGAEMHQRQLRDLARRLGELEESDTSEAGATGNSQASRPSSAAGRECRSGSKEVTVKQGWAPVGEGKRCGTAPARGGTCRRDAKKSMKGTSKDKEIGKADNQNKARKDMVLARINAPLPTELTHRKVCTSWSSPAIARLYTEDGDRNVLRKSPSEAFHLQMKTPAIASRPASAPRKAQAGKSLDASSRTAKGSSLRRSPTGKDELAQSLSSSGPRNVASLAMSPDTTNGTPHGTRDASRKHALLMSPSAARGRAAPVFASAVYAAAEAAMSPNEASASRKGRVNSAGHYDQGCELITMEVKPIGMKTTMQRLEQMSQQFRHQSFGEYMKEYDIFTGDKKARLNGARLRNEEETYVRDMQKMVGGKPLGVNPFSKSQIRRMAQAAGTRRPPEGEERAEAGSDRRDSSAS